MATDIQHPRSILITGASSGIGAALAMSYAAPGVHLALSGRNEERLAEVAIACRTVGAEAAPQTVDVRDREAMIRWINDVDAATPLDLVVANAGVSAGTGTGGSDGSLFTGESEDQMREIFAVNLHGVLNTVWPVITPMRTRGKGQIAIVSSLAGFLTCPRANGTLQRNGRPYSGNFQGFARENRICNDCCCSICGSPDAALTARDRSCGRS